MKGFGSVAKKGLFPVAAAVLLVVSLLPTVPGHAWSSAPEGWERLASGGVDYPESSAASAMAVYAGKLYLGAYNPDGCRVWSYDGLTWYPEVGADEPGTPTGPGFGQTSNTNVSAMAVYGSRLYVSVRNASRGCSIWSFDGGTWTQVVGQGAPGTPTAPGFGNPANRKAASMAVFDAGLYVGTYDSSGGGGCEVWSYDGANWVRVAQGGFGEPGNLGAVSMAAGGIHLYVGTYNDASGCQVWRYDGAGWSREATGGFGYPRNTAAASLVMQEGKLLAGTQNQDGFQVWRTRVAQVLYFAEGYTGSGFQEYLCLGNPHARPVRTAVTYMFNDGTVLTRKVLVPAESRMTIHVNTDVGPDREVSVELESEGEIAGERPVYFKYGGNWSGGHVAAGAGEASSVWYFAEGYTGEGFEEWVCVLNPMENPARLSFYFQTEEGGVVERTGYEVPARSRRSFSVNELLGPGYQHSLKLISDSPVVAERPMYFDYLGAGQHHWQGGHCVRGAVSLSQTYYFAEGTTRAGFEEWLTIQNPNPFNILVYASFQPGPGQGSVVERSYIVRAGRRYTVYVPGEVGRDKDVSILLVSTACFLAERPMYFDYAGRQGGDCVMGCPRAGKEWFLAEGYTGPGFHTWLCIQNPGSDEARVVVTYLTQEVGALPPRLFVVPPRTRQTVFVNHDAGEGYQLSLMVRSDSPVVVERPMYFEYAGTKGGHTLPGW